MLRCLNSVQYFFLRTLIKYISVQPNAICVAIEVSGCDCGDTRGTYYLSNKTSKLAPERPVWKLDGKERYILYAPDNDKIRGWIIGNEESLDSMHAWYTSKKIAPIQ